MPSVKPGIPIFQLIKGPDQDYTVANILNAFVRGETVTVYSFDSGSLVPNRVAHIARIGLEYMVEVTDENDSFVTGSSSTELLTDQGFVAIHDLEGQHKLIQPTGVSSKEVALKSRKLRPKRSMDPTEDEREIIYMIRLEDEPANVVAGNSVVKVEKAEDE